MEQYINNMETEVRCGYEVSYLMKRVWNIQLNMAKKLLSVCEKYNLKIWGVSGTALGAIRHKGFIPWDDDMDFIMKREDYDTLVSIADKEFEAPLFFQTVYSDKGFCAGFAKIRYDDTSMLLPFEIDGLLSYHMGIFIDIFVMDSIPDNINDFEHVIQLKKNILNYHFIRNSKYFWMFPDKLLIFLKNGLQLGVKAFWPQKRVFSYLENKVRGLSKNETGKISPFMFEYNPRWIREERWFDKTIWLPFEGIKIPIPIGYDEMLSREYGDYMVFKRSGAMHTTAIMDPDHNYTCYKKSISTQYFKLLRNSFKNIWNYFRRN